MSSMELPVVVGVDGSAPSLRAVDWAAEEAALHGVPLRVVFASLWERYEGAALAQDLGRPSEQMLADDIVASAARRAEDRFPNLKVFTDVLPDDAVHALVDAGRGASMLVVASRGRSGIAELVLGSVSLAVAARADCPVIVLRGRHGTRPGTRQRIVLGVGAGPDSAAVRFAFEEAADRYATLQLVRAWRRPAHEPPGDALTTGHGVGDHDQRAAESLDESLQDAAREHPSVRVRRRTVEGPAHKVLVAESGHADLLVVGARRRPGQFGLQLGRVAYSVLHDAACPVAVVPQRA